MGRKKADDVKEKRGFTIHGREIWLRKDQIEKEFGCPPEDVEKIWQSGEKVKADKPTKPGELPSAKPSKKVSEEEILKVMEKLAANGVVEVHSRLISDKLGLEPDYGRSVVRRLMKKLEADGKVVFEKKAVKGKRKSYVYRLKREKA